jgi:DNA-directed RNA polymerase specialized sigma24 family protein
MEDLMHEAFIELFCSVQSYRGETRLATWADRVTARVRHGASHDSVLSSYVGEAWRSE